MQNVENFARVGKAVLDNFNGKFHDGEFNAPANHDPRMEAWDEAN